MKNAALVVIDLQNDITKNYKEIIGTTNQAIDWAVVSSQVKYTFFRQKVHTFEEGISPQECRFSQ